MTDRLISVALALSTAAAGALWGGLALLIGHKAFGPAIWAGVMASPLIGLLVARCTHARYAAAHAWRRWLWALTSLYLGAMAFGLSFCLVLWPLAYFTHRVIEARTDS